MAHLHEVRDMDTHFIIDPLNNMAITNANEARNNLQLGDHDSEVYTFELPRFIEGHDMTLCNLVEVHFINAGSDKVHNSNGVFVVEDMEIADDGNETLLFTWTVSGDGTKYAGSLNFRIKFSCIENGKYTYKKWSATYKGIIVADGFDNGAFIETEYADVLAAWESRLSALEQKPSGVQTVNGVAPDGEGNVVVEVPSQVQSDLSVNDESDPAFVKGVIRQESLPDGYPYKKETERRTVIDASDISWRTSMGYSATVSHAGEFINFVSGNLYIIEADGVSKLITCESDGSIHVNDSSLGLSLYIYAYASDENYSLSSDTKDYNYVKVFEVKYDKKYIDEDFIPLSVAMPKGYINSGGVPIVLSASSGIPTEWGVKYLPENIVSSVNGVAPSEGNVTLNVYTKDELAAVATSGKYQDLEGIPVSKTFSDVLRGFNQLTSKTINGNKFMKYSGDSSEIKNFLNEYSNKLVSFQFNSSGSETYEVKDQTARVVVSNATRSYTIWGNCSLYSSSYENTGENYCVYAGTTNGEVYAFYEGWSGDVFYAKYVKEEVTQLSEEYIPSSIARTVDIPKASAVPDAAGETPTAAEFNALLAALRNGGIISTE